VAIHKDSAVYFVSDGGIAVKTIIS